MSARRGQESSVTGAAPQVCVASGFYEGLAWPLDRPSTVIGRGRSADLVLNEATISRAHALFGLENGRPFVQDLGSTNGTLVNGERSERCELADGDELRMGRLVLRMRVPEPARV
jgi:pSer/pThr/pTyr-binding forkhead associated (FHA) protein